MFSYLFDTIVHYSLDALYVHSTFQTSNIPIINRSILNFTMLREYMKKSFLDLAYMEEEEARDLIGSIIYDPNGVPGDECLINAEHILK